MTYEEFQNTIARHEVVVAYFSHDACNVCKVLKPQVRSLVESTNNAEFIYVNTMENPDISGQFMVFAVPTIIIFFAGKEARRYSRHLSIHDLSDFLQKVTAA